jgi:hypothetical protein
VVGLGGRALADRRDPLEAARAAKDRVDYDGALRAVDAVLARGGLSVADTRAALLLRGEILAGVGRDDEATDEFAELLALDPSAAIDRELSPRVLAAFDAAVRRDRAPLVVTCAIRAETRILEVRLQAGSSARARQVRVERTAHATHKRTTDLVTPPAELVLRASADYACFAVDARGNALAAGPDRDRPLTWSSPMPPAGRQPTVSRAPSRTRWPLWRNPWLWGGAAVAAGAAGATFHVLAARDQDRVDQLTDDSEMHEFADVDRVFARGERRTAYARAFYAGAGLLAIAAVTFALLPPRAPASDARLSVAIGPDGIALAGEF